MKPKHLAVVLGAAMCIIGTIQLAYHPIITQNTVWGWSVFPLVCGTILVGIGAFSD